MSEARARAKLAIFSTLDVPPGNPSFGVWAQWIDGAEAANLDDRHRVDACTLAIESVLCSTRQSHAAEVATYREALANAQYALHMQRKRCHNAPTMDRQCPNCERIGVEEKKIESALATPNPRAQALLAVVEAARPLLRMELAQFFVNTYPALARTVTAIKDALAALESS
jgi:hypothetical protein